LLSVLMPLVALSDEGSGTVHDWHSASAVTTQDASSLCVYEGRPSVLDLDSVQLEVSDLAPFEQFFGILKAPVIEQLEHPGRDRLRGYCYRGVVIIVRQDLQTPRPTGWVQINFTVQDAAAIQQELERLAGESPVAKLEEAERYKIIRFRLKPDVKRGDRKVVRLEVFGPDGFMIGFNQYK
jgi:hypothetical protein